MEKADSGGGGVMDGDVMERADSDDSDVMERADSGVMEGGDCGVMDGDDSDVMEGANGGDDGGDCGGDDYSSFMDGGGINNLSLEKSIDNFLSNINTL